MFLSNKFTATVGVEYPIVQAPMAGGATTPELVAAVCNAGALGSFAAGILSPAAIVEGVQRIRALTDKPFNVNLFVLDPAEPTQEQIAQGQRLLAPIRAKLGLGPAHTPARFCEDMREQIRAVLALAPRVVSFTFGVLEKETVTQFQQAGCLVIGTATTVAEARAWEEAEAGGHRGTFIGDFEQASIGLTIYLKISERCSDT